MISLPDTLPNRWTHVVALGFLLAIISPYTPDVGAPFIEFVIGLTAFFVVLLIQIRMESKHGDQEGLSP